MELSSKRCTEDNIKYPAACMQNFDRIRQAVFSQDYLKELLYFTIICYTRDKMRNFNIILLFIQFLSESLHLFYVLCHGNALYLK